MPMTYFAVYILGSLPSSQMLSPSAFALELRGGVITRFPSGIADETYKELDSFKNITYNVLNAEKALRFKQYNEILIPEEEFFLRSIMITACL